MDTPHGASSGESDRIAWLALRLVPDLGNRSVLRLINRFGSPRAVLDAEPKELATVEGLRGKAISALQRKEFLRHPETEWETLQRKGVKLLALNDPEYPSNLSAIPDPPAVLFVRGELQPRDLVAVAVVGSRAASPMGMIFTEKLSGELALNGVTIVSGFAVGIDSAAHRGAIKAGGRTIAVLGCGLDIDYPYGQGGLRDEIAASGALVTEFPLGTPPVAGHFPQRNRIISGLSLGVVVVEAAHRSGSLITARLALEQGREVFAVPGMAHHYRSVGPHRLLREGAKLVEGAEDVLEELRPLIRRSAAPPGEPDERETPVSGLEPDELQALRELDGNPRHIDEIARSTQWPVGKVMAVLSNLELKGVARQLPGKYFVHTWKQTCRKSK
ncbi:DNA-processing protein DprA [Syntrophobacter fumaroxidans]|uniref:DNA protecting protein DprA n=1 Tax=Syntrophobacter fumaroxidans (strain DSM 10017 / MPOB) TaxID=335543 RepID=A0LER1_SYNFM|nr:DNA-processing protein DprA [Syntrophobacter fumaroxidans]ABK15913.1 DNA protecting protein DprA [Syntrophobacter fumaroxidans MPOB]